MSDDDTGDEKTGLRSVAEMLLPDSATARMSRIFDVNQRSVQKWLSGQNPAPTHVIDWMNSQGAIIGQIENAGIEGADEPTLEDEIDEVVGRYRRAGVHEEVVGAHLALAYKRLLHREVE